MNLIDYNQAVEALEKERQLLLNREQYDAENVLVHHALNVIAELPVIRQPQIVRCKDCKHFQSGMDINGRPFTRCNGKDENNRIFKTYGNTEPDWFYADGKRK